MRYVREISLIVARVGGICGKENTAGGDKKRPTTQFAWPVAKAGTMRALLWAGWRDDTVHAQVLDHLAVMIVAVADDENGHG